MEKTSDLSIRHSGMIAVIGAANAGKSTLINHLAQEKVSIVSPVAQTTRNVIRMIVHEDRGQLVFLDTPGIHKAESELGKQMNKRARQSINGADISLLILDGSESPRAESEGWMRRLLFTETPLVIGVNKMDCKDFDIEPYQTCWNDLCEEKEVQKDTIWLSLCAKTGDAVSLLLDTLFELMPPGPDLFPDDLLTDYPKKLALADVIREQYFLELKQELPHAIAIRVDAVDENPAGWKVEGTVFVNRSSQKGIVIGNKGRLLKRVEHKASLAIKDMYDLPKAKVKLWVKIEKKWDQNFFLMQQLGYVD